MWCSHNFGCWLIQRCFALDVYSLLHHQENHPRALLLRLHSLQTGWLVDYCCTGQPCVSWTDGNRSWWRGLWRIRTRQGRRLHGHLQPANNDKTSDYSKHEVNDIDDDWKVELCVTMFYETVKWNSCAKALSKGFVTFLLAKKTLHRFWPQLQFNVITQSQRSTRWYCFDWTWTPFVVDRAGATVIFPP